MSCVQRYYMRVEIHGHVRPKVGDLNRRTKLPPPALSPSCSRYAVSIGRVGRPALALRFHLVSLECEAAYDVLVDHNLLQADKARRTSRNLHGVSQRDIPSEDCYTRSSIVGVLAMAH
ncbi:GSCOCG00012627001-RA-CDS [Cotesia congregata]|nr:GSCOCG00012627001-RA-CDS [Cotesia congregata]